MVRGWQWIVHWWCVSTWLREGLLGEVTLELRPEIWGDRPKNIRRRAFQAKEQQMQRPWNRYELGVFEGQKRGPCGYRVVVKWESWESGIIEIDKWRITEISEVMRRMSDFILSVWRDPGRLFSRGTTWSMMAPLCPFHSLASGSVSIIFLTIIWHRSLHPAWG